MHAGVKLVVCSGHDRDVQVITGIDLIRAVDELMPAGVVLFGCHVILYFLEIDCWHPRVSVNNGQKD
jgi:hypothetical protein